MNKTTLVFLLSLVVAASLVLTGAAESCTPTPGGGGGASGGSSSIGSIDPNEISGPSGFGENRIVQRGDRLDYVIYFENKQEATAAAYLIKVTLPQDPNLDWTTLRLGEVVVSSHTDLGLVGKASGSSMLPMSGTPGWSMKTDVVQSGGNLEWTMRLWDPATIDHYPDDPTAGILPPNDPSTHIGEGHVSFSVSVKSDAAGGAVARAAATIVFDTNDPITTDPSWWNTIGETKGIAVTVDGKTTTLNLIVGMPYGELPEPGTPPEGCSFGGWFTQPDGKGRQVTAESLVEAGDEGLYQYWRRNGDPEPQPVEPEPVKPEPVKPGPVEPGPVEPVSTPTLFETIAPAPLVSEGVAYKGATYNGFLGEESLGGTFTLVVKKPKKGLTTADATLTKIDFVTGKKVKVAGTVDTATGLGAEGLAGLLLNVQGVGGKLGDLAVQGAIDGAKSKDASVLATMNGFNKRVYGLVFADAAGEEAYLTVTFSTKGKVKVAGTYRGAKVSGSTVMSVGDRCAVPFVWSKKGVTLTFVLWFDKMTMALTDVSGLGAGAKLVAAGSADAPSATYDIVLNSDAVKASVPDAIPQTFDSVVVSFNGKKFDAGKAAKVAYKNGELTVDTAKGDNVTDLKLSCSKGVLKGSFTVYAVTGGKLAKNKFTVAGVMVDGKIHAVGTNKKLKPIPVVQAK